MHAEQDTAQNDPFSPRFEVTTRRWTCELHQVEYGDVEPGRIAWECPQCEDQARREQRAWERRWVCYDHWRGGGSGIPYRFHCRTRANWRRNGKPNTVVGQAIDGYAAALSEHIENGTGLVLLGSPGLGKSHLLIALVGDAIAGGWFARYAVWPDVVSEVKAGFNLPRDEQRRDLIRELKHAPLLALDELALKANASEFEHSLLFDLLDHRYREQLPTLVASNATPESFPGAVGERIADRLTECGITLVLTGTSQRLAAATSRDLADAEPQLAMPEEALTVRVHAQGIWRDRVIKRQPEGRRQPL